MLIDTHCHINMIIKKEFDVPLPQDAQEKTEELLVQAKKVGVTKIINVGTSLPESANCVTLARMFTNIWATLALHPNDIHAGWKHDIAEFEKLLKDPSHKIVGIGEVGLDYHYFDNTDNKEKKELQYTVLRAQIELALQHNLPLVIHTRDAGQEVLAILEEYKSEKLRGIIHCFSEDMAFAQRAIKLGFLLGIGGPLTYPKNEVLRTIFSTVALEHIVLETDAPFLAPQSIRGKQNSPASINIIAEYLANLRGISFEEVAQITTCNAEKLFGI